MSIEIDTVSEWYSRHLYGYRFLHLGPILIICNWWAWE